MSESLFSPEVIAAVIAGLFGLVATLISLSANRRSQGARDQVEGVRGQVEGVRGQVDRIEERLLELRLEPYGELWALTKWPGQTPEAGLTPEQRKELLSKLRGWYYQSGYLLTQEATNLFGETQRLLEDADPKPTAEETLEIRHKLSELRTQLTRDLGFI